MLSHSHVKQLEYNILWSITQNVFQRFVLFLFFYAHLSYPDTPIAVRVLYDV